MIEEIKNINKEFYTGWKKWTPTDAELATYYTDNTCPVDLKENEYLIVIDAKDNREISISKMEDGKLVKINHATFKSKNERGVVKTINPRNAEQRCAFDMLSNDRSTVKLITGGWGCGKAIPNSTLIPTPEGLVKMGDLKIGDYVYGSDGKPTKILGVFPQGKKDVYEVSFVNDCRKALCCEDHLWQVCIESHGKKVKKILTTKEMLKHGIYRKDQKQNRYYYLLPIAKPVEYNTKFFEIDPYVIGSFIGNGCNTCSALTLSSADEEQVEYVRELLKSPEVIKSNSNFNHIFRLPVNEQTGSAKNFQTREFFKNCPELLQKSSEKRIPQEYLYGDVKQRLSLLQGLLDTDGTCSKNKGRIGYSTTSYGLVEDILSLCFSLGLCASYSVDTRRTHGRNDCYNISIQTTPENKVNLFKLTRKKERCIESLKKRQNHQRNYLTIRDIKKLNYQEEMTCIYVANDDHLFLMNDYIVTHNTMLMVTAGLQALKDNRFDKIIWIRNNVDVKDTKDLGALPGDIYDKLMPFLGPFVDHAGGEDAVKKLIEEKKLVVEPLQYLRGRNLERTLIMCSEAENLTREHLQLIIARCADGSELWLDGDTRQRDKISFENSKGLERLIESLKGNKLFGYVHLTKVERSETASLADKIL